MTRRAVTSDFAGVDTRNTYYRLLQVDELADTEIIRLAYRHLARRYHPDVMPAPQAAQRMAALNEAYEVLRDPQSRARYDAALDQSRRAPAAHAGAAHDRPMFGEAGIPEGPPSGSVLDFGRYRGWTLGQIRRRDPEFLEWLVKMPVGRRYRTEVAALLRRSA